MKEIVVDNDHLRLGFDARTGALSHLEAVQTGWRALARPELALSYQLLMPLAGRRNNPVLGEHQTLSDATVDETHHTLHLTWEDVVSECGGRHDVRLSQAVNLKGPQVVFELTIENRSGQTVESVHFPYLGDVATPPDEGALSAFLYRYGTAQEWRLRPHFDKRLGFCMVERPTQYGVASNGGAPTAPFVLLRSSAQGVLVRVGSSSSDPVMWNTELYPGYRDAIDERVPDGLDIAGTPIAVRFAAVHLPFIQPGETRTLTPIVVEPYQGGWQRGVDRYREWRRSWSIPHRHPSWIDEPHSWHQIQMNSPEDELRFSYQQLVDVGRECAEHGVGTIQLVGWNDGGQDQNNPSHDVDPRLGTAEDLKEAIRQVKALSVRVVLFSKFTWADRATQRFREELHRLAIKDPYGDYYLHPGYRYNTPTQLLDVNTKRLIPMCFLSEAYLRVCQEEFLKVLALRPDGILFDECFHHGPALLCFDRAHGHRAGAPVYANDRELIDRFRSMAEEAGIDFLFAGEACYDWEFEAYDLSYHRSCSPAHVPLMRYLRPSAPVMTAIMGFDDRNMVNQCLLYRYVMSYEPYQFKGRLHDFPLTLAYGKRMDALRTELRGHLWDGTFQHESGARVTSDGADHHPYSVFAAQDGSVCVAIANYDECRTANVTVELDTGREPGRWRTVDEEAWHAVSGGIEIPPRSAVVVLEV